MSAATEWTAWQLAFQPQLGRPWFILFGWPVYQPPAFFWWWFAYDAYAHEIFVTGGFIAGAGGVAAFVVAVAMSVWRAREVKKVTTYGSARWAEAREIRKAGLAYQPAAEGESVSGLYRQRMTLASGRFAMIDDGLGFQLVPWRPALEKELGREVRGVIAPGGNVEWSLGRKRGLGL